MEWQAQLTLIVVITVLAVISPGPDFAVTIRNSLMHGRRSGLVTAVGIASGVSVHIVYTLLGLGYILAEAIWLLEVMRYLGAAYLIWLGIAAFRTQKESRTIATERSTVLQVSNWVAFKNGFVCNALNPKTALFFIALFTQVVDPDTPAMVQAGLGVFIATAHFLWFAVVALLLTHARFKGIFERSKGLIERAVGLCLLGLGAKLAFSN
jgi:RhtB (resistance to homoserine/threonine) family protein